MKIDKNATSSFVMGTPSGIEKRAATETRESHLESGASDQSAESVYANPISAVAHEGMADLYELGLVDKVTMDRFDQSSLVPVARLQAPDIKALREREKVSQSVMAKYLGIAINTLSQWERGARKPDGPALKLLSLIERHGLEYIR